jgi:uncharacterized protein YbjQ (UPF0145 family)
MTAQATAGQAGLDPAAVLRQGVHGSAQGSGPHTSDLTIDELIAVHSVGYDAVELVTGNAVVSIPYGAWTITDGEILDASRAHHGAFELATKRLLDECHAAHGEGVVGVDVTVKQSGHGVEVSLTGTAIRSVESETASASPFASDLSGQDFAMLVRAGWRPVGLALGASYMHVTRSSVGQVIGRVGQNTELTLMTESLYAAREAAMERMQSNAIALGGRGVVDVKVTEGTIGTFAKAVAFAAYGTVIVPGAAGHQLVSPMAVLPMDDPVEEFEATSLK